jgi:hypothetical protein
MKLIKRELKCTFTEKEIQEKAKALAYNCNLRDQAEEEKKSVTSDFKAKIDSYTATISSLSNNINNGWEYRSIDCEVQMDTPKEGVKRIVRKDTGEVVEELAMTPEEMQFELDLKTKEKKK